MSETEKAIRDNFPGKSNAGLRKELREAVQSKSARCAVDGVARRVALTASGKAGIEAVKKTIA